MKKELKLDCIQAPNAFALYKDYIDSTEKSIAYRLLVFSKCLHAFLTIPINFTTFNKQKQENLPLQLNELKKILLNLITQATKEKVSEDLEKILLYAAHMLGLLKNCESIIDEYLKKQSMVEKKSVHSANLFYYLIGASFLFCCGYCISNGKVSIPQGQMQSITCAQGSGARFFIFQIAFASVVGWRALKHRSNWLTKLDILNQLLNERNNLLKLIEISQVDLLETEKNILSGSKTFC